MWKIVLPIFAAVIAVESAVMTGGFQDVEFNTDEGAQNALNFSVAEHNRKSNDMFLSQVAQVISVKRQVVSGMKYVITVKMARTPCRKGSANEVCTIHEDPAMARPYQCKFTVWSRPWIPEIQLTEQEC